MSMSTNEQIVLIDARFNRVNIAPYMSHLTMVRAVLDSGALGDGCYGDDAHIAALESVRKHIQRVQKSIKRFNAEVKNTPQEE